MQGSHEGALCMGKLLKQGSFGIIGGPGGLGLCAGAVLNDGALHLCPGLYRSSNNNLGTQMANKKAMNVEELHIT